MSKSVLIVCTSRDKFDKDDLPTGCWMEEVAAPYYVFKAAGHDVKIVSIQGGEASAYQFLNIIMGNLSLPDCHSCLVVGIRNISFTGASSP